MENVNDCHFVKVVLHKKEAFTYSNEIKVAFFHACYFSVRLFSPDKLTPFNACLGRNKKNDPFSTMKKIT